MSFIIHVQRGIEVENVTFTMNSCSKEYLYLEKQPRLKLMFVYVGNTIISLRISYLIVFLCVV